MELIKFEDYIFTQNEPLAVTIGAFDGIHIAHQVLIKKTVQKALDCSIKSAVITFDPHPLSIINNHHISTINTIENKAKLIANFSVDYLIVINFNESFSKISKEDFVNNYLLKLNVKEVIVGSDFKFGYKGKGIPSDISIISSNIINTTVVDILKNNGEKIGSSKIKSLLSEGLIEEVNELLGYEFFFSGNVIKGRQVGRKLGFPTANIDNSYIGKLLKPGVYGVRVHLDNNVYLGMMNVGHNPTCNFVEPLSIEINLFDFNLDLYNKNLEISCFCYVRNEIKFQNVDELINRLNIDKQIIINKNHILAKKIKK